MSGKLMWTIALIALGGVLTWYHWSRSVEPRHDDFVHYWATAKYIKIYVAPGINPTNAELENDTKYHFHEVPDIQHEMRHHTPLFFTAVDLLSSDNIVADARLFHTLSLISYCFIIVVMLNLCGYSLNKGLILFILFLFYCPKLIDSVVSSTNSLQLGILALTVISLRVRALWGYFLSGLLLAIFVLLKPNTLFIPYLLILSQIVRRQWRIAAIEMIGGIIGGISGIVFGAAIFSSLWSWRDWIVCMGNISLTTVPMDIISLDNGNISLSNLLLQAINIDLTKQILIVGLLAVSWRIIWLSGIFKNENKKHNPVQFNNEFLFDLQILASAGLVYLLFMKLVWTHYYTIAIPVIIFLLSPGSRLSLGVNRTIAVLTAIMAIQFPMLLNASIAVSGWFMYCGALVLFVLGTSPQLLSSYYRDSPQSLPIA